MKDALFADFPDDDLVVEPAVGLFDGLTPSDALHDISHIIRDWYLGTQAPDKVVVEETFGWLYQFTMHLRYPASSSVIAGEALAHERVGEFKAEVLVKCPCE